MPTITRGFARRDCLSKWYVRGAGVKKEQAEI